MCRSKGYVRIGTTAVTPKPRDNSFLPTAGAAFGSKADIVQRIREVTWGHERRKQVTAWVTPIRMVECPMLKVLEEAITAVRSLDHGEQERAAQVLLAWLNGSSNCDLVDA